MTKTLKKFCKLSKYIEQIDKDLFQVLDDLCILHYLKPTRNSNGVTFLYPKEKAYRQKIINSAYSNDPNVAVNMVKSLILQGYYNSARDFDNNVVNLLNQKIQVEESDEKAVKLSGGLSLSKDEKFVPMGFRENMTVYTLSGKGEIPLDGQTAEPKKTATGGNPFVYSSRKNELHRVLEQQYINEIGSGDNIYVKKVALQLRLLSDRLNRKGASLKTLLPYLGNDEFSDSYLLDMYCEKHCAECFNVLYKCLRDPVNCSPKINEINREKYISIKKNIVGEGANDAVVRLDNVLNNVASPMDIRARVNELYRDKRTMGKDLFIVFCNIYKDMWLNDRDAAGSFKNFSYLASRVFTKPEDLVDQEFNAARDLTLYGNLLKSDVLNYVPQAEFKNTSLRQVNSIPNPLDMSLYSLCALSNKQPAVSGGSEDPEIEELLRSL